MNSELNLDAIKEAYLVSNTATFLFDSVSNLETIRMFSVKNSTISLIDNFNKTCRQEIKTLDDLVVAYALFISIMLKDDDIAYQFIKDECEKIGFEWFPSLRQIFLGRTKALSIASFKNDYGSSIKFSKYKTSTEESYSSGIIEL